jgi:CxxC motif-containing protein
MLTITVRIKGCPVPVTVKSSNAILKNQLPNSERVLKGMLFPAPVAAGDILATDFQGLNADIVETQNSFR